MDALDRALEIRMYERLLDHESAHAAAALVQGIRLEEVVAHPIPVGDTPPADPSEPAGRVTPVGSTHPSFARKWTISVLAGHIEDGRTGWPPSWPLSLAPETSDEWQLGGLVEHLGLDRAGYESLVKDAFATVANPLYRRLRAAIKMAVERHGRLDRAMIGEITAISVESAQKTHPFPPPGTFSRLARQYAARTKDAREQFVDLRGLECLDVESRALANAMLQRKRADRVARDHDRGVKRGKRSR